MSKTHPGAAEVIAYAKSQVGYHEGRSGGHWNNREKYAAMVPRLAWANGQPWCDTFVCACFAHAGLLDLIPVVSASCDISANGWRKAGRWSEYPAVGAQIFYGTPSDLVHTGIVYTFNDRFVYTIEGNTNGDGSPEGDGVYLKRHERRSSYVVGYGYPDYHGGIVSADPKHPRAATPHPNIERALKARGAARRTAMHHLNTHGPHHARALAGKWLDADKAASAALDALRGMVKP